MKIKKFFDGSNFTMLYGFAGSIVVYSLCVFFARMVKMVWNDMFAHSLIFLLVICVLSAGTMFSFMFRLSQSTMERILSLEGKALSKKEALKWLQADRVLTALGIIAFVCMLFVGPGMLLLLWVGIVFMIESEIVRRAIR